MIGTDPDPLLRRRAAALALVARTLGCDVTTLLDDRHVSAVAGAASRLDDRALDEPIAAVERWRSSEKPSEATLAGRWVRWFDLGGLSPYEGSNVVLSAGGVTPRLADVAGYYRAFGMRVQHDRPDHV